MIPSTGVGPNLVITVEPIGVVIPTTQRSRPRALETAFDSAFPRRKRGRNERVIQVTYNELAGHQNSVRRQAAQS